MSDVSDRLVGWDPGHETKLTRAGGVPREQGTMLTAIFTIVSRNYLPYASVLMKSIEANCPEYRRFVCIADEMDHALAAPTNLFDIISASEVCGASFAGMAFRYDVMEFNTAVKPFMFRWLLEQQGFDRAIYLDPDIFVYRPLAEVDRLLDDGASAIFTPHLLRPLEDGLRPDDHDILQSGVYNLGFAAMRRVPETLEFLHWWGRRLEYQCYCDVGGNLFTDQRWCDYAPAFLPAIAILRHPGYNLAYWNLGNRTVHRNDDGSIVVDGQPLIFFHFSGLRFEEPRLVSKHQTRLKWSDLGAVEPLFTAYRTKLIDHGWADARSLPYAYDNVGGMKLVGPIRGLYRKRYPGATADNVALDDAFVIRLCNQPVKLGAASAGIIITELMMHLYRSRSDLQAAFNLSTRSGVAAYARWFESTPEREYGLDPRLTRQALLAERRLAPLNDALPDPIPNAGRSPVYRLWRKLRKRLLGLGVR